VASRYADHNLIIIGTGDRFFDPVWGRLHPWTDLIQSFARRVIMTPVPRELWGYRERQLHERLKTEVLPLSPQAIPDLVEVLAAEEPAPRALRGKSLRAARRLKKRSRTFWKTGRCDGSKQRRRTSRLSPR
jgi:hypothetical protein